MNKLNLIQRIISSILILPSVLLVVYLGGIFYSLLLIFSSALVFYELSKINNLINIKRGFVVYLMLLIFCIYSIQFYDYMLAILICGVVVILMLLYRLIRNEKYWLEFNLIYSIIPILILYEVRNYNNSSDGLALTILIISTAVISDIAGYSGGMLLGSKKIFPTLSPNKTLEGTFFALIVPTILVTFAYIHLEDIYNYVFLTMLVFAMSVASVGGDLFISGIKRKFKLKDTGSLIPGHGGFLDRADSIIGSTLIFLMVTYTYGILGINLTSYL
tara:strand:+ start:16408 stop:17229 length:822 start_codon:yes stop_codon:yes gene_type:complete